MQVGGDCLFFAQNLMNFIFFNWNHYFFHFFFVDCAHILQKKIKSGKQRFFRNWLLLQAWCEVNKPQSTQITWRIISAYVQWTRRTIFWPESLILLHEKTCGHRMVLFSKRLSISQVKGLFFSILVFFFRSLVLYAVAVVIAKTHYRFISEIINNDFFCVLNACQQHKCNLNEFHSHSRSTLKKHSSQKN